MAAASVSKPQSAYWMWMNDNRAKIQGMVGNNVADVGKKAGEMWKALPDAGKMPYEKKAKEQKEAYEKFIATPEGQKALADKKSAKADEKAEKAQKEQAKADKLAAKEERKNTLASKAAVKAVSAEKDDNLKKPQSAYWLWLGENRQSIVDKIGTAKGAEVAKKGGEMWKALSDTARAPWEKKAKDQKDAYDKYINSAEGAAALKAFKDATQAAKDQFKPKEAPAEEEEEKDAAAAEKPKKRKADAQAEKVPPPKALKAGKAPALGA